MLEILNTHVISSLLQEKEEYESSPAAYVEGIHEWFTAEEAAAERDRHRRNLTTLFNVHHHRRLK